MASLRRRTKGHAHQPLVGKKTAKGAGHDRQSLRRGEDQGRVPGVREPIFEQGHGERQFGAPTMLRPAMAAAQAFRGGPLQGRRAAVHPKGGERSSIGGDGALEGPLGRGRGGDPDMRRAKGRHGRKIQPIRRGIAEPVGMGQKRRAVPVNTDPS